MKLRNISIALSCAVLVPQAEGAFCVHPNTPRDRRIDAYRLRRDAANFETLQQPNTFPSEFVNPDEVNLYAYAGNFTKLLDHDTVTGLLTSCGQSAYKQYLKAIQTDYQSDWNAICFHPGTQRKLINPQSGYSYSMEGIDSSLVLIDDAPLLASAEAAADLIETYLMGIAKDVSFEDYGTGANTDVDTINGGSITNNAASILDALSAYPGPKNGGTVDASVLFRGTTAGDLNGPYVSQFFIQPLNLLFPAGCAGFVATLIGVQNLPQAPLTGYQTRPIAEKREFGVSWDDFVAIQNGLIPKEYASTDYDPVNKRYPINGRDLGSYVHYDGPYEPYYNALVFLAANQFPISPVFPYANGAITKESAGFNQGPPDAFALVGGVCLEAFKNAWQQKFVWWRRLRPEAMAGLVHRAKEDNNNPYNLDASLFGVYGSIDFLAWVQAHNALQATVEYDPQQLLSPSEASTYLLGQMYPEGSPAHTSYPGGHATSAGACTTVIKAIFNDQYLIINKVAPVKPDPSDPTQLVPLSGEGEDVMTVGGELDKLASNIGFAGRCFAGVHYRLDCEAGLQLGETIALCYLQDHMRTYPEEGFNGYQLTLRDGTRVNITPTAITPI